MRDARMLAGWILALFLAVMFLWIADLSLFGPPEKNVIFPRLVEASGIYLWEPTGRYVVGIGHVLAALALILPWTRRLGAILAFLIAGGAVAMHLLWLGVAIPTDTTAQSTDGGQLFYLALGLAVAALALAVIHPGRLNAKGGAGAGYYGR